MNYPVPIFADKQAVEKILGIRNGTLKNWRIGRPDAGVSPVLQEGIHWVRQSSRHTLYNVDLLRDFIANRASPEAHERAIAAYLESLPSSQAGGQTRKRRRAA
jgi:hypothetical protein